MLKYSRNDKKIKKKAKEELKTKNPKSDKFRF